MSKSKLILRDWQIKPGFQVSVGIGEICAEIQGIPLREEVREIHRVDLKAIGGVTLPQKIEKTRLEAEQWIASWYETQELQDRLNQEAAREVEALCTAVEVPRKPAWLGAPRKPALPGRRC